MLFGVRASKNTYLGKKLLLIRQVKRRLGFYRSLDRDNHCSQWGALKGTPIHRQRDYKG